MSGNLSKLNTTSSSDNIYHRQRITQSVMVIWEDTSIDQSNKDCQNTLVQLQSVVDDVHIFTQRDECIDFLTEVDDMKVSLVMMGTLGQQTLPVIHDIPQLDGVYIYDTNKCSPEQWTKTWVKVKDVHTEITPICESLQQTLKQFNQDSIAVSFVTVEEEASGQNLDKLEPSFMYTQLFKEILLEMKHDQNSINDFILFWGHYYINNTHQLNIIAEFELYYRSQSSIWWYTRMYFLYQKLNEALRTLDADTIIKMGFFIHDLYQQIEELHQKQVSIYRGKSFIVYRGQGLSTTDFEKLRKTKGGLMSFNNFLSTSKSQNVSLGFAASALSKADTVGILFQMSIDPSVSSAPFASIDEVSYFKTEEEILFSMHTVFRIGDIKQINKNNPLYQVELTLTSDDDTQLCILTKRIREEAGGGTGWQRIGILLAKISQFDKAEELYTVLLEQTSDEGEKALYNNNLGLVKNGQGDYEKALCYYEKSLEIRRKTLPPNHPDLATSYNNIGSVYRNMGEYSKALSFYEKDLEICQKSLLPNHLNLALSYNNIGGVYLNMGEYSKALSFHGKSLEIYEKTLPPNHPDLATSYSNIGGVYLNMGEYSKALSFYEKSLEIWQKTLPPNHPDLAQSYNNIGLVYNNMGEYSKALSFYEKDLEIRQKTLPPNHPDLATSYNNIGVVYKHMGEYSKALSFYEKSFEIRQKALPPNHPDLAGSYNNIGLVYNNMGEYSKALSFYEKDLEIRQKTFRPNYPDLATSYNNIGVVYLSMGAYSKALSFYEKSLEIWQKTLPPNHPHLAQSYNNIGSVYRNMGEYSKALSFYEKSLEIFKETLPPNHPDLATLYNNIGLVYKNMGEYSKALSFYEKSFEIRQKALPPNHPDLAGSYNNIAEVNYNMENYSIAISYFERALYIFQSSLPPNHPNIKTVRESIEIVKKKL
jgi:tetratricopeptide (TPR) repeat protein